MKITFNKECTFISSAVKTSQKNNNYSLISLVVDGVVHPNLYTEHLVRDLKFGESIKVIFELNYNTKYPNLKILEISK